MDSLNREDSPDTSPMPDQSGMPDQTDRSTVTDLTELSATEAAQALGVAERSVRRYIARGKLPARRVMNERGVQEYRISAADVAAFQGVREALDHEDTQALDKADMPAVQDVPHPAALALQVALAPIVTELAAAREERAALQAEREDLTRRNAHLHDLTSRQAEELGRLRADVERAKTERIAASMHATQMIDEERAREAARPWWAFWRRPGPAE